MFGSFNYLESCINSDADSIDAMVDQSEEITKELFFYNLEDDKEVEVCGFDIEQIRDLYGFTFYKSVYRGEECLYMENSRIEYIFIKR